MLSQQEFGIEIGKNQGVVSRYESGEVAPPGDVIMHCMHILEPPIAGSAAPSGLAPPVEFAMQAIRGALTAMIEAVDNLERAVAGGDMPAGQSNPPPAATKREVP